MTTAAYILESVTHIAIGNMAKEQEFIAQEGDVCRPVKESHVILRDTPGDEAEDDSEGEKNIQRPAIIITPMGSESMVDKGQNSHDDIKYEILIQIVDDVPAKRNTVRRKTYAYWFSQIRKELQANPYKAEIAPATADIFLIQVTKITPAQERDFRVHNQMKVGIVVNAYVREPRT